MPEIIYTEQEFIDLQVSLCKIGDLLNILNGYCEFHADDAKVNPLLMALALMKEECRKISDKF